MKCCKKVLCKTSLRCTTSTSSLWCPCCIRCSKHWSRCTRGGQSGWPGGWGRGAGHGQYKACQPILDIADIKNVARIRSEPHPELPHYTEQCSPLPPPSQPICSLALLSQNFPYTRHVTALTLQHALRKPRHECYDMRFFTTNDITLKLVTVNFTQALLLFYINLIFNNTRLLLRSRVRGF